MNWFKVHESRVERTSVSMMKCKIDKQIKQLTSHLSKLIGSVVQKVGFADNILAFIEIIVILFFISHYLFCTAVGEQKSYLI